jgi:hypothetical protein
MQQVAIVMGFMLTMQWPGLPEIKAPIYTAGEEQICYSDRDEIRREEPGLDVQCDVMWATEKPEAKPHHHRVVRYSHYKRGRYGHRIHTAEAN